MAGDTYPDEPPANATEIQVTEHIVTIAEDGDVLLLLPKYKYKHKHKDEEIQKKLRVSSIMLSYASPVFKAMLGPQFAEGQVHRSASQPLEVKCTEDHRDAMTTMCMLLHHQKTSFHNDIGIDNQGAEYVEDLLEIAYLVDKYQCTESLKLQAEAMMGKWQDRKLFSSYSTSVYIELAQAAYYFDSPRFFFIFTKRIVMQLAESPRHTLYQYAFHEKDDLDLQLVCECLSCGRSNFKVLMTLQTCLKCSAMK